MRELKWIFYIIGIMTLTLGITQIYYGSIPGGIALIFASFMLGAMAGGIE